MDPAGRAWKLRRQSLPTGSHNPNKLAHRPAKRPLSRNQAPAGNYPTPALDQRPRNRPRRDGGSCYEQESATENGKLYTREGLILLIGWSRPERIGFLPKILRAAEIAQGPFLSSISFGPAKEMDPAGRAWKLGRQSLHTGSRAKGAHDLPSLRTASRKSSCQNLTPNNITRLQGEQNHPASRRRQAANIDEPLTDKACRPVRQGEKMALLDFI